MNAIRASVALALLLPTAATAQYPMRPMPTSAVPPGYSPAYGTPYGTAYGAGPAASPTAPPTMLPAPQINSSPLLYVRFSGPAGMKASFFQGRAPSRDFTGPVAVGMRPGYRYRVQLGAFTDRPGLTLYPTIEVRGSLCLQPRLGAINFPALLDITQADLEAAASGNLVTKVIYLEHPDRADPRATLPGQILETDLPPNADMLSDARRRGRVILVVHFGERIPSQEELILGNIPGTILFPGQKVVGPAACPPCLPGGGRCGDEECLRDGGDRFAPVGYDSQGNLGGLDPEDTVGEYTDSKGRRSIVCSNRVCLTVPRFAALRSELPLEKTEGVIGLIDRRMVKRDFKIEATQPSLTARQLDSLKGFHSRSRASVNIAEQGPGMFMKIQMLQARALDLGPIEALCTKKVAQLSPAVRLKLLEQLALTRSLSSVSKLAGTDNFIGTAVVARVENGPDTITATMTTRDLTVCCNETPIPPDKPLVVVKCADKGAAQVGDEVTFSIRYSNVGGRAMSDVAVTDSLSPRLEYVPGTAESDRESVFTIQPNEAGSSILRWEVSGKLQPGQSGRVRFKVKVR